MTGPKQGDPLPQPGDDRWKLKIYGWNATHTHRTLGDEIVFEDYDAAAVWLATHGGNPACFYELSPHRIGGWW